MIENEILADSQHQLDGIMSPAKYIAVLWKLFFVSKSNF